MKEALPAALNEQAGEALTVDLCDRELERLRKRLRKVTDVDKRREIRRQVDVWLDQRLAFAARKT